MINQKPVSEQERAIATVSKHELQLRQAQDNVRCASEVLRRAVRTAERAEGELGAATRRLAQFRPTGEFAAGARVA